MGDKMSSTIEANPFNALSDEMLLEIFSSLDKEHLFKLRRVNKKFNRVIETKILWKKFTELKEFIRPPLFLSSLATYFQNSLLVKKIEELFKKTSSMIDSLIEAAKEFPLATLIRIQVNTIEDANRIVDVVSKYKHLISLNLQESKPHILCNMKKSKFNDLVKNVPLLKKFTFIESESTDEKKKSSKKSHKLKEENFVSLANDRKNLSDLCLKSPHFVTDKVITIFIKNSPKLNSIQLNHCNKLTNDVFKNFCSLQNTLERLSLSQISVSGLKSLLGQKYEKVKVVWLIDPVDNLDAQTGIQIVTKFPNVEELVIPMSPALEASEIFLSKLLTIKSLKKISLLRCSPGFCEGFNAIGSNPDLVTRIPSHIQSIQINNKKYQVKKQADTL